MMFVLVGDVLGGKPWVAVFAAEDEVKVQRGKGIGHRFVPRWPAFLGLGAHGVATRRPASWPNPVPGLERP